MALKLENEGLVSQAVDYWIKCGNYTYAEELYSRKVLPQFLKLSDDFEIDKSIYGIAELSKSKADECLINKIREIYPLELWLTTPSGLFKRVKKLQESLQSFARHNERSAETEIALIIQAIPNDNSVVSQWLRT